MTTNWFLVNAIPVIIIGAAIGWLLSQIVEDDGSGSGNGEDTTQQGSTVGGAAGGDDDGGDDGANGDDAQTDGGSNGGGATNNVAMITSAVQNPPMTYLAVYEITSTAPNGETTSGIYRVASDVDSDPPRSAITLEGGFGGSETGTVMIVNDGEMTTFCVEMQCFQTSTGGTGALPIPTLFDPTELVTGAVAEPGVTVVQTADRTFDGITGSCYTVMDSQGVEAEICIGANTLLHLEGTSPDGDFSFTLKEFRQPSAGDFELPDYEIVTLPDGAGGVDSAPQGPALVWRMAS